ncbi:MAG: hypothetical protein IPJ34_23125 [Myxococcales bacterium]|nr:hypothetical protein [Myxococcales bacterium]
MSPATRALPWLLAFAACAACAGLVGYDDLRVDAVDAPPTEVATDAPVADVDRDVGETPPPTAVPPGPPTGDAKPSGKGKTLWFAVDHLFLGQRDPLTGSVSADAWRGLGHDVDRVCTGPTESKENTNTCRRPAGANQDSLVDGLGCRDNNFGAKFLPLAAVYLSTLEADTNARLLEGSSTLLFALDDLDDGPDDPYVVGRLYSAAKWKDFGKTPPRWDGTDQREVTDDTVVGGDVGKPISRYVGYLAGNVWVSGAPAPLALGLPFNTIPVKLSLVGATVTIALDDKHERPTGGVISGGMPTRVLGDVLGPIADVAGVCPGSTLYNSLFTTVTRMADLVEGQPRLQSTAVECDTMSVGLAFTAVPVVPPTTAVPRPGNSSKCDAGPG